MSELPYLVYCKRDGYWEATWTKDMAEEIADMHYEKTGHSPIYIIPITRPEYYKYKLYWNRYARSLHPYLRQVVASRIARRMKFEGEETWEQYRYI